MGILLHELLTHDKPWCQNDGSNANSIFQHVVSGDRPRIPAQLQLEAPAWCKLTAACWAQSPRERPTFPQIWEELQLQPVPKTVSTYDAGLDAGGAMELNPTASAPEMPALDVVADRQHHKPPAAPSAAPLQLALEVDPEVHQN